MEISKRISINLSGIRNLSISTSSIRHLAFSLAKWILIAVLFGLAYNQSHLYNDNQNTKFLHGMANEGLGLLKEDWLANTADPLPVFSFLVQITYATFGPNLFYAYFVLLMGVYVFSIMGIAALLYRTDRSAAKFIAFFAIILAIHSIQSQLFVRRTFRFDLTLLQYGVAGQYLLGLDFQNSSFGVFLLLSMYAFLRRKNVWAILWMALACIFHPAYLFGGALLTGAYTLILFKEKMDFKQINWQSLLKAAKEPFLLGVLALVLVSPLVWYNQVYMGSTSPELARQALAIIVHDRIPHHSIPSIWLNRYSAGQIVIVLVALFLVRKTRLFLIMLVPFLGAALFTVIQIWTNSDNLAFLAPWRVSVFLVPLSTCLIAAFFFSFIYDRLERFSSFKYLAIGLAGVLIAILVYDGVDHQIKLNKEYNRDKTHLVMDYVRDSMVPGQVYLIPPRDNRFDEFRLYTGAPTFINWKSHPYRDFEVLEWSQRNKLASEFYAANKNAACNILQELSGKYHVTHIIFNLKDPIPACQGLQETYRDKRYALYAVNSQ